MPDRNEGDYSSDIRSINQRLLAAEGRIDELRTPAIQSFAVSYAEPTKPRGRDIVFADGTHWDPGSGRGFYAYNDNTSAWVLLLSLP